MKNTLLNKRIPTVFGLFIIMIGIGILSYLVQNHLLFIGNANPSDAPKDIRISNISDTSFTISYTTNAQVIGSVSFGNDTTLSQVALDDRDQITGIPTEHTVHSITLQKLSPQTSYFFSIHSGSNTYINGKDPYQTTTGSIITTPPSAQNPLTGKVVLPTGDIASEAIVYVQTDSSQTLSTLVKPSGLYALPLNTLRNNNLTQYMPIDNNKTLQLLVTNDSFSSHVLVSVNSEGNIPTIALSKDYDFTISEQPLASLSGQTSFLPAFTINTLLQTTPDITTPKDNESLIDAQPNFTGTAPPDAKITLTINPLNNIQTTITADKKGIWSFRPNSPISIGKQKITITTNDSTGVLKTIQHTFTILEAGTQVNQSATPSATPIVTEIPPTSVPTIPNTTTTPIPTQSIPTPTLSPLLTMTPTPSIITSPTFTPTQPDMPTITTQTNPTLIPTKGTLPPTGNGSIVYVGLAGIITTIIGFVLFVITHSTPL